MATKRSKSASSAKKRPARKKATSAKQRSAKKAASKKPAAKKPTKKPAAKKRKQPARRFTSRVMDVLSREEILSRAAETAAAAASCPECVIQQIQAWGGGTVTGGAQTLQQLSVNAPCSDGRLADLRQRLRTCTSRTIPLSCSATVGFILERACPFA